MVIRKRQRPIDSTLRSIGLGCVAVVLSGASLGCAALYPEIGTPVRGAVSEDRYDPPPPKNIVFVAIKGARIPNRTPDGRNWDKVGGSAPDPYAVLFIDDKEVIHTVVIPNTLRPDWPNPEPVNLRIEHSSKVRIEVWDDNALVSHPICNQGIADLPDAAAIGDLEVNCQGGARVLLTVEPPKARLGIGLYVETRGKEAFVSRVIAASTAGRAGLAPGDRILAVGGRATESLASGELESILRGRSGSEISLRIRSADGRTRKVLLRDEPMYPVKGEGIDLLVETKKVKEVSDTDY